MRAIMYMGKIEQHRANSLQLYDKGLMLLYYSITLHVPEPSRYRLPVRNEKEEREK